MLHLWPEIFWCGFSVAGNFLAPCCAENFDFEVSLGGETLLPSSSFRRRLVLLFLLSSSSEFTGFMVYFSLFTGRNYAMADLVLAVKTMTNLLQWFLCWIEVYRPDFLSETDHDCLALNFFIQLH